jgi:hypothetical protein
MSAYYRKYPLLVVFIKGGVLKQSGWHGIEYNDRPEYSGTLGAATGFRKGGIHRNLSEYIIGVAAAWLETQISG